MRPVNLLPEDQRPHVPSGQKQGSAYIVVGACALALLALVSYVLVANQVTSRTAQAEQAKTDADAAEAKAAALGAFGTFAQMKETRESSVKTTATERFDWERLSREMARVVPTDVFVTEVDASANVEAASQGTTTSGGAGAKQTDGPHLKLTGCAASQKDVATTMVRLRALHRAEEVTLEDSTREELQSGAGPAPASGAGENADGCGTTDFKPNYKFVVHVAFAKAATPQTGSQRVPSYLGGGA